AMLDRAKSVTPAVFAGEDAEHARHGARRVGVDCHDAGVRVGRTHKRGKDLTLELGVVAEAATAGDEPQVLLAAHRLADGLETLGLVRSGFHCWALLSTAPLECASRRARPAERSLRRDDKTCNVEIGERITLRDHNAAPDVELRRGDPEVVGRD